MSGGIETVALIMRAASHPPGWIRPDLSAVRSVYGKPFRVAVGIERQRSFE